MSIEVTVPVPVGAIGARVNGVLVLTDEYKRQFLCLCWPGARWSPPPERPLYSKPPTWIDRLIERWFSGGVTSA